MWHAECYGQDPEDRFPVLHASDLDDAVLGSDQLETDDPNRFRQARDGDHLMSPTRKVQHKSKSKCSIPSKKQHKTNRGRRRVRFQKVREASRSSDLGLAIEIPWRISSNRSIYYASYIFCKA
jgi:hypothetical protein